MRWLQGSGNRMWGGAEAGASGVVLDHMADIDRHHEGRPAFGRGQRAGVVLGLLVGFEQRAQLA